MDRRMVLAVSLVGCVVVVLVFWGCLPGAISGGPGDTGDDVSRDVFTIIDMGGGCPDAEGTGCVTIDTPDDSLPPEQGGCFVTGIGTFGKGSTRDSFGGNGMGCLSGGNFQIHPANNGHPYGDGAIPDWSSPYYAP